MKLLKILALVGTIAGLTACNSGTTTGSDVQTFSGNISNNNGSFNIQSGTATGCLTITNNGSCSITFTYYGSNNYLGPLSINTLSGYTSNISSCSNITTWIQSCSFTINNTGGSTSNAQQVTIYGNGQAVGLAAFDVGGGI